MNTTYIKDIVRKSNTSIKTIEKAFGYEPFTRKEYEEMLDSIPRPYYHYGKHEDNYTIESLIKHGIIKIVKVETFSRVGFDMWENYVRNRNNEDIMTKELWDMLSPHVRNLIMETAEDNGNPIGYECQRFYYAWTGATAEDVYEILKQKAIAEMQREFEYARMEL